MRKNSPYMSRWECLFYKTMSKKSEAKKLAEEQTKVDEAPRRAILSIAPQSLLSLLVPGEHKYAITENGLPPDAKIVDVRFNTWKADAGTIEVLIEHVSLPQLEERLPIPYVKPPVAKNL